VSAHAEIYDLGYKRYAGPRRAQSARWRVIMRHQIAQAWKGWWRYKLALALTFLATTVSGIVMYVYQDKAIKLFGDAAGQRLADTVVPLATLTFCKIGFLVSMTISASAISDDSASGAFTFYFVRSTRPIDYVLGKLAGLYVLVLPIMLVGPLVLAGIQLALTPENHDIVDQLGVIPRTLAIGLLGTLIYAAVPLGFSAMAKGRMIALGGWAVYYLVIGNVASGFAAFVYGPIGALDLGTALSQTSIHLFGLELEGPLSVPLWASIPGILIPAIAAIAVASYKVKQAADSGVGGAS
jgi:hypothetical protein